MHRPAITVVVVSDYASTAERSWNDERRCIAALAAQDFTEPYEILLSESEKYRDAIPADLHDITPRLRLAFSDSTTSYGLKNAGVRAASSPLVAIMDADCHADRDWLRLCVDALRSDPEIAAVSGRTFYEGTGITERVLCLLTRSYTDPGHAGETSFASNNAVGYRKEAYLAHPLPENLGPFSARIQSESVRRSGMKLWFEPRMRVVHEFEGVAMERDIRRNIGYGTVATRLAEPSMPYASLIRSGAAAIPLIMTGKLINTWRDCLRCASAYNVRWFELPVALCAAVAVNLMETPGMLAAYRGNSIGPTAYR